MFRLSKYSLLAMIYVLSGTIVSAATETPLTLQEAVHLALSSDDPYLQAPVARAAALENQAISDAQLNDPKIRLGFANWPTDSFSYSQEPMTQVQLGVSQSFPRGNTRQFKRDKRRAQARGQRLHSNLRQREVILDTRQAWLDLYYWTHAASKVKENKQAVTELIEVIQSNFAVGKNKSQDIYRAEMELGLLDDRLIEISHQADLVRARLSRRVGVAAHRILAGQPALKHPSELAVLVNLLGRHPAAELQQAKIEAAGKDVDIANEQYKPGWTVNVGYGARGGDRANLATVGVTMDVPLFTQNRQDRQVSAAKKMRYAQRLTHDAILLDLRKKLSTSFADWKRLEERIQLYKTVLQKRAKDTSDASLLSYQNGTTDFPELIRSRLVELDTELKLLRLQTDKMKAQAALLYFEGEEDA